MNKFVFKNKKVNVNKLIKFGFLKSDDGTFEFSTKIFDDKFEMHVYVAEGGEVSTVVKDILGGDEYVLHLVKSATGAFVGKIREEHEEVLIKIKSECFDDDVYKSSQTNEVLEYILNKYEIFPEFPWNDENSVVRRKDNKKWFAVFLKISPEKIGLCGKEKIEVLNLKMEPSDVERLTDGKKYFKAYHMNKKHWVTIPFGNFVDTEEILLRIDESYRLAKQA